MLLKRTFLLERLHNSIKLKNHCPSLKFLSQIVIMKRDQELANEDTRQMESCDDYSIDEKTNRRKQLQCNRSKRRFPDAHDDRQIDT
jgi:hypothetical protein